MGLAGDYVAAIKSIGEVGEGMFNEMSPYCRFYEEINNLGECYYHGQAGRCVCAREICPVLQGQKFRQP